MVSAAAASTAPAHEQRARERARGAGGERRPPRRSAAGPGAPVQGGKVRILGDWEEEGLGDYPRWHNASHVLPAARPDLRGDPPAGSSLESKSVFVSSNGVSDTQLRRPLVPARCSRSSPSTSAWPNRAPRGALRWTTARAGPANFILSINGKEKSTRGMAHGSFNIQQNVRMTVHSTTNFSIF